MKINIEEIEIILFDFDGVMTDNRVFIDQSGNEFVGCNRSDGLAIDCLKKLKKKMYIISSEKNKVVSRRGEKLGISVYQNIGDKLEIIKEIAIKDKTNFTNMLFVGNDLNDLSAIKKCRYSVCPNDSHKIVKEESTVVLSVNGGYGVIRELVETILSINIYEILYKE